MAASFNGRLGDIKAASEKEPKREVLIFAGPNKLTRTLVGTVILGELEAQDLVNLLNTRDR